MAKELNKKNNYKKKKEKKTKKRKAEQKKTKKQKDKQPKPKQNIDLVSLLSNILFSVHSYHLSG